MKNTNWIVPSANFVSALCAHDEAHAKSLGATLYVRAGDLIFGYEIQGIFSTYIQVEEVKKYQLVDSKWEEVAASGQIFNTSLDNDLSSFELLRLQKHNYSDRFVSLKGEYFELWLVSEKSEKLARQVEEEAKIKALQDKVKANYAARGKPANKPPASVIETPFPNPTVATMAQSKTPRGQRRADQRAKDETDFRHEVSASAFMEVNGEVVPVVDLQNDEEYIGAGRKKKAKKPTRVIAVEEPEKQDLSDPNAVPEINKGGKNNNNNTPAYENSQIEDEARAKRLEKRRLLAAKRAERAKRKKEQKPVVSQYEVKPIEAKLPAKKPACYSLEKQKPSQKTEGQIFLEYQVRSLKSSIRNSKKQQTRFRNNPVEFAKYTEQLEALESRLRLLDGIMLPAEPGVSVPVYFVSDKNDNSECLAGISHEACFELQQAIEEGRIHSFRAG